ncbi:hypothetical protein ACFFRR_001852 [Megaselia abdita]
MILTPPVVHQVPPLNSVISRPGANYAPSNIGNEQSWSEKWNQSSGDPTYRAKSIPSNEQIVQSYPEEKNPSFGNNDEGPLSNTGNKYEGVLSSYNGDDAPSNEQTGQSPEEINYERPRPRPKEGRKHTIATDQSSEEINYGRFRPKPKGGLNTGQFWKGKPRPTPTNSISTTHAPVNEGKPESDGLLMQNPWTLGGQNPWMVSGQNPWMVSGQNPWISGQPQIQTTTLSGGKLESDGLEIIGVPGVPGQPLTGQPGQPNAGQPGQPIAGQPGQPNAGQRALPTKKMKEGKPESDGPKNPKVVSGQPAVQIKVKEGKPESDGPEKRNVQGQKQTGAVYGKKGSPAEEPKKTP